MAEQERPSAWISAVLGLHLFAIIVLAMACYSMPERLFGDTAWLPMARLAAAVLAASLLALALHWASALRSGEAKSMRTAMRSALVLDVQLPILMGLHPAILEYVSVESPLEWWGLPLLVIFGGAVPALMGWLALGRYVGT